MPKKSPEKIKENLEARAPVIAIMGHVDHGKSTLLDYIRKTNVVEGEAGGITQKISAYEVVHKGPDGKDHKITFLDTPGHEAFKAMRARGAKVADIAILVVSAEDGVRPQTVEALQTILKAEIPYIVAINKIDRPGANVEKTKVSLAENNIYVEGFGGNISSVPISAKTGEGVSDLLDLMLLTAELEELKGDATKSASGVIIEAHLDKQKGISASLIIKDGTLRTGSYVVSGAALSPVRIMENFLSKPIKEASFSSPVRIIGWNEIPVVGSTFKMFDNKKDAEAHVLIEKNMQTSKTPTRDAEETTPIIPIVLKAREDGGLAALEHEIAKIKNDKIKVKVIASSVGDITENDVKVASGRPDTIILGFNTKVDASARSSAERFGITIQSFDIIYKLSEWLQEIVVARTPKVRTEEASGLAKVLKIFSKIKDKQVLGGRVEKGLIHVNDEVKIMRRDFEIGRGRVRELQKFKDSVKEVPEGQEFGTMVESKIEIAPGDRLESFTIVEK
jgi:translation initiation factor IF-2